MPIRLMTPRNAVKPNGYPVSFRPRKEPKRLSGIVIMTTSAFLCRRNTKRRMRKMNATLVTSDIVSGVYCSIMDSASPPQVTLTSRNGPRPAT